ncbi:extracellular solute-binding protein [Alkalibacterium iburiense]|uniref:Extracellular solute-binding protein n=1 Tax=Alkalibacterium iburiense TaxID=290589 RepID=A0ABP3GZ36_9LACT
MIKKWKRFAALTLASGTLLAACGNGNDAETTDPDTSTDDDTTTEAVEDNDEPTQINWMNILHTASPPTDTIINEIEEYTNTELDFTWIPDASKEERLNTALASGNLGDIVTVTILNNSSVRNAYKAGAFWDVEPFLDDYENLSEISEDMRRSASIEGIMYGIPFQKPLARNGIVIRQDWLDNLGLDVPETLDELYEVARAFTEDDPDGDGQDNTFGFIDRADLKYGAFKTIATYHGAPNEWLEEDGTFTPEFDTQEYVDAMDFLREAYENGYINQDFAVTSKEDQQEGFAQGRAGIYVGNLVDARNLRNMSEGLQDHMELVQVNKMSVDGNSPRIWSDNNGIGGLLSIPVNEVETEEELRDVLQFLNDIIDEEVYMLMTAGIEGVHYEVDGNTTVRLDDDLWQQEVQPFSSSRPKEVGFDRYQEDDPVKVESDRLILENEEFAVLNPAYSLESETFSTNGSELAIIIEDATYQYILGDIDLAGFEDAVQRWYDQGGQQIIDEYEAAYEEAQANMN